MEKMCSYCKNKFESYDKRVEYCSIECAYKGIKENHKNKWFPILEKINKEHWEDKKSISYLSKKYNLDRGTLGQNLQRYGFKCRNISEMRTIQCKEMTPEQKKRQTKEANKASYKGISNTNFRKRIFKFFPNFCFYCGEKDIKKLVAHHLIPQVYELSDKYKKALATGKGDHRVRNGIIVCTKCHKDIHRKQVINR